MAEECADCGAPFANASELMEHMKEAHSGGDSKASMEMNPESHHAGLVCSLCGARFRTRAELARHNLSPHSPDQVPAQASSSPP
jgi:hypothetical protein